MSFDLAHYTATVFGFHAINKQGRACDLLGMLQRSDGKWTVTWRWRHHLDDRVIGSQDEKHWYRKEANNEREARALLCTIVGIGAHAIDAGFFCAHPNSSDANTIEASMNAAMAKVGGWSSQAKMSDGIVEERVPQ